MPAPICPECESNEVYETRTTFVRTKSALVDVQESGAIQVDHDSEPQEVLDNDDDFNYVCDNCEYSTEEPDEFIPYGESEHDDA